MAQNSVPQRYAGILFRSTNEARYAKFFDQLGLKWEWEPRGVSTDSEWYRPDFLIFAATGSIWAECKFADEDLWSPDVMRFRRFAVQRPQPSRAVLFTGVPAIGGNITVIGGDGSNDPVRGLWEDDTHEWVPCPGGYHFDIAWPGKWRGRLAEDGCDPHPGNGAEQRLEKAVRAARNARFGVHEHKPRGTAA